MSVNEQHDILQVQGINSKGYGIIPKLAMQDKRLTAEAKAIYGYFCSYAGAGQTAFPSRSKIISDLKMSVNRYYKHFNLLLDYGYIKVEQIKGSKGKFERNVYTLIQSIPCSQNGYTKKNSSPCIHYPYTENPCTENRYTNNNSLKNKQSFKSNKVSESAPAPTENTYGEFGKVRMPIAQYEALITAYGRDMTADYINRLDQHIASTSKQYADHYATVRKWMREDEQKKPVADARPAAKPKQNRFCNFKQRERDYAELERLEREHLIASLNRGENE